MPLIDEREKERKRPARSALMMESFETNLQPEQLLARLDVVGRHACSALYNAQEYRRIPMRFLWLPLAYVQDGLGGKAKAITASVLTVLTVLVLAMIFVPFPLKMDAPGQSLPKVRQWIYPPMMGNVEYIPTGLASGKKVYKGQPLFMMFDAELGKDINKVRFESDGARGNLSPQAGRGDSAESKSSENANARAAETTIRENNKYLQQLQRRVNANLARPGEYTIAAPKTGIILNADFREQLLGKNVRPGDPLIRIGFTDVDHPKLADWEIELKIPQKHYGQVLRAFKDLKANEELVVDVLFTSAPTRSYQARLRRDKIASQANTQKDDNNETEPIVIAWARIDGDDIPASDRIPPELLLSGGEVHTRIRCGNRAMGYALFYGVYEFAYEKVIFPYFHW